LDEIYTDDYIEKYWDRHFPTAESIEPEEPEGFVNPGEDGQVRQIAEFLAHLDDRVVRRELDRHYKVRPGIERYPREAMFRAFLWRRIAKERSLLGFHRLLGDSPFEALELGFKYDPATRTVRIPSYQALWHFGNVRLDVEELDELLDAVIRENARLAGELGVPLGVGTATDATPLETCRRDRTGVWNGHYKLKMVKVVITEDVGTWLPLSYRVIGGNDGEGEHLVLMLMETRDRVGPRTMEESWFDGGFTSNENLAKTHALLGLKCHFKITKDWVGNVRYPRDGPGERSPEEEVHRLYSKLWEEGWYHAGVPLWYKMRCLVRAGRYEAVAMHFRNAYMAQYEESPDGLLDAYHVRNNIEGVNGHLKDQYGLEDTLNVVGERAITRHVLWTMLAAHIVAMVRLQHGVTDNLLSTTHLH
jgi:hypothetical protein